MKSHRREHLVGHMIVWIARVSRTIDSLSYLVPYLDARDRERAARFHFPEDRTRFVMGRALLRICLGHYLRRTPEAIELAYTDHGRPILPQDEAIQFSISHSHDLVALALTTGALIGIDLEHQRPHTDLPDLAKQIFSEEDLRAFQAIPAREMPLAFFRAWTRKEAYLKARGEGIADGVRQVSVSLGPEEVSFIKDARDESAAGTWRLLTLPVSAEYMGMLACNDPGKRLECDFVHFDKNEVVIEAATVRE